MRSIDIHAHVAPARAVNLSSGEDWHGFTKIEDSGRQFLVYDSKRNWLHPSYLKTPEQRLEEMENELASFKLAHVGELPHQQESNLSNLDQLTDCRTSY